jgi:hypothetical protein
VVVRLNVERHDFIRYDISKQAFPAMLTYWKVSVIGNKGFQDGGPVLEFGAFRGLGQRPPPDTTLDWRAYPL